MFTFKAEQRSYEIGKIRIGGQPGENPTVLIGTIFYHGQKIVLDENTGRIDKNIAEELINLQDELSEKTGNPCMLDVVASTKQAMKEFISFVADFTEAPFLVDSPSLEVKAAGLKHAIEVGLKKRLVYNSLTPDSKPDEFEVIKDNEVESAVLLAYKKGIMTSDARVKAVKELVSEAEKAGVTKPLIDTFVMDIPSLLIACKALLNLKMELGLPCGCGAHNAISTWPGFKKRFGIQAVKPCTASVDITPILFGADFVLYGPIEDCEYLFPAVYAVDTSNKFLYRAKEQLEL